MEHFLTLPIWEQILADCMGIILLLGLGALLLAERCSRQLSLGIGAGFFAEGFLGELLGFGDLFVKAPGKDIGADLGMGLIFLVLMVVGGVMFRITYKEDEW
ncbi:MAG: hypothetical protein HY092_04050 [Candidatus Kerfeldbacteria bacterium]|nr:hypothetical protein [Candidatus Kerfeldbacteria bacterium]